MSNTSPYLQPATLISYDAVNRTAQVAIAGLTDGLKEGIEAMLAYPIGHDDRDTEIELQAGADVWVFFEQGDSAMPVIAFYRRHGKGLAVVDTRRIRQKNIELLARANITLKADDLISIKARAVRIEGDVTIIGDIAQTGNQVTTGNQTINGGQTINGDSVSHGNQTINGSISATDDIKASGVSLKGHRHGGVESGGSTTSTPR